MATDITTPSPGADAPVVRRWTREEYHRLGEQGFFTGQRVELIEGEIVVMSPQGPGHTAAIHLVAEALHSAIGQGYWIRNQGPLALSDDSEPEPDIAVVPGSPRDYPKHPQAALLVVEVSDSTRHYDLSLKAKLYAAARGIPEYWVVDLVSRQLVVMRDPQDGAYQSVERLAATEMVTPKFIPAGKIPVQDLLP